MTEVTGRRRQRTEEQRFLEDYDATAFPPVAVTVDIVLLTIRQGVLSVLLIQRGTPPFRGRWALPGGFVQPGEDLEAAARRELAEETGVTLSALHLEQLQTYGAPNRDPRMRVVSVAHLGLMPDLPRPGAGTDAAEARFWPVDDLSTADGPKLAFDHERIVVDGIERARSMLETTSIATSFVEAPFTIADLRRVYESVWGTALHPANFRRKVLSVPELVIPTGEERATGRGWTALYRAGPTRRAATTDAATGARRVTALRSRPETLDAVRAALSRGEYLEAFDQTVAAGDAYGDDLEIAYLAILALVRAGATGQATKLLEPLASAAGARDDLPDNLVEDIAALEARLAKDRALGADPTERQPAARIAAERYEQIYRRLGRPYTCVNAATMWLIAGDQARAVDLARAARALVTALTPETDGDEAYWLAATDAEAALILGEQAAAAEALARAAALVDGDLARAATTRKQLRLICEQVGADVSVLAPLAPPRVVHYCGHMISRAGAPGRFPHSCEAEVATAIAEQVHDVALGFGSLACGADILYAEALLDRNAELHVHLPCTIDDFIEVSVEPGGPGWLTRFHQCLDAAASVSISTAGRYLNDPELFAYCSRVAMGHALIRAEFLSATAEQLAVWDGLPPRGSAGTAVDIAAWAGTGLTTDVITVVGDAETNGDEGRKGAGRTVRAMLFADLAGFGRLDDSHIPAFLDAVMSPLATVIARFDEAILFRNTWGDGIYLVFGDVVNAAECALEMQVMLERIDLLAAGLPDHLAMRIAAHAGPVLEREDPILRIPGFYGVEVTRAARMEPRTPEGAVYVTDQFAALLTLEPDAPAMCQYVGRLPSAKNFGTFPMYVLTARH